MAVRPTVKPDWALIDEIDGVTGNPNKIEPTLEFKASGLKREQPLPRQYLNYNLNLISKWVDYLDEVATAPEPIANILSSVFPVGSVHFSVLSSNPSTYGYPGTWVAISQGRAIVGVNIGDSDFNTVEKTGGSKTHTHGGFTGGTALTLAQMPSHSHNLVFDTYTETGYVANHIASGGSSRDLSGNTLATASQGSGATHNHTISSSSNLMPYLTLYIWKRTA